MLRSHGWKARASSAALLLAVLGLAPLARAGVINPDISVIGQPFTRWTNDAGDPAAKRVMFDLGETEVVFDAYLNPYARGTFVMTFGEEGAEVEEGFFTLLRGLPAGLALKGGKYRVGFGKLNPVHPHAYPFAERFRTLATFLPGEESFNEVGVDLSTRIPLAGDVAVTASVDVLQGDSFRIERESSGAINDPLDVDGPEADRPAEPRPVVVGRLSGFIPVGDISGLEIGLSAAQGTNNVAAASRTKLLGADVKAKLWNSARSYVVIQGELVKLDRDEAGWDETAAAYTRTNVDPIGGYLFADYNFNARYNVGASYERYQSPDADKIWDQAVGVFTGLALLEETTAFRISFERLMPGTPSGATVSTDAVNSVTLRVIYSMGPHKAHQF